MKMTLKQWGNSLALRIPKVFAVELGISKDNEVDVDVQNNQIIISPKGESLNDLLSQVTPEMVHGETPTGGVVGSELW